MTDSAPAFRRPDLLRLDYDTYRALPAVANSDLSRLRDALDGRSPRLQSSLADSARPFIRPCWSQRSTCPGCPA